MKYVCVQRYERGHSREDRINPVARTLLDLQSDPLYVERVEAGRNKSVILSSLPNLDGTVDLYEVWVPLPSRRQCREIASIALRGYRDMQDVRIIEACIALELGKLGGLRYRLGYPCIAQDLRSIDALAARIQRLAY